MMNSCIVFVFIEHLNVLCVIICADVEHTLRRDLRRTKALLQDAQLMLQKHRDAAGSRTTVKQLRNQVPAEGIYLYCNFMHF